MFVVKTTCLWYFCYSSAKGLRQACLLSWLWWWFHGYIHMSNSSKLMHEICTVCCMSTILWWSCLKKFKMSLLCSVLRALKDACTMLRGRVCCWPQFLIPSLPHHTLPCNFVAPFHCGWAPVPSLDRKHMAPPYGLLLAGGCQQMWKLLWYRFRLCAEAASCISTVAMRACLDWPSRGWETCGAEPGCSGHPSQGQPTLISQQPWTPLP